MIDARGNETRYTYNAWGMLESTIEPATTTAVTVGERSYVNSYNASRRVVAEQLPDGITVAKTYDRLGGLASETGTSTTAVLGASRQFVNDRLGRRVQAVGSGVTIASTFDDRGLLSAQSTSRAGSSGASEVAYRYDPAGRLVNREDGAGSTRFAYDSSSRVTAIEDPLSDTTLRTSYNHDGQPAAITSDNGALDRRLGYDQYGRPVSDRNYNNGTLVSETVTGFDPAGNTVSVNETHAAATGAASRNTVFGYDRANRLMSRAVTPRLGDGTAGTETVQGFAWDAASNRTQAGTANFAYNQRNQLTSTTGGESYGWSDRGTRDTLTVGTTTVTSTYDALGQLRNQNGRVNLAYDPAGRIDTRTDTTSGRVDQYSYSDTGWDPSAVTSTTSAGTSTGVELNRDADATLISTRTQVTSAGHAQTSTANLVGTNNHTDINTLTAADGTTNRVQYDPFGNPETPAVLPVGYQGDITDPVTGLVWMGHRHYDPTTSTFTQRDTYAGTIREPVTLNRYLYGNANPITNFDPDGRAAAEPRPGMVRIQNGGYDGLGNAAEGEFDAFVDNGSYRPWNFAFDDAGNYSPMMCTAGQRNAAALTDPAMADVVALADGSTLSEACLTTQLIAFSGMANGAYDPAVCDRIGMETSARKLQCLEILGRGNRAYLKQQIKRAADALTVIGIGALATGLVGALALGAAVGGVAATVAGGVTAGLQIVAPFALVALVAHLPGLAASCRDAFSREGDAIAKSACLAEVIPLALGGIAIARNRITQSRSTPRTSPSVADEATKSAGAVDEVAGSEFLDDALRMNEQPLVGKSPPAPSPNFLKPTNPAQLPPESLSPGHSIRPMGPTAQYPDGYWVETNAGKQPIDISTGRPPSNVTSAESRARTHVPYPPR